MTAERASKGELVSPRDKTLVSQNKVVSPEIIYTQTTLNRFRFIYIFMHLSIWVAITDGEGEASNLRGNWGVTGKGLGGAWVVFEGKAGGKVIF